MHQDTHRLKADLQICLQSQGVETSGGDILLENICHSVVFGPDACVCDVAAALSHYKCSYQQYCSAVFLYGLYLSAADINSVLVIYELY